MSERSTSYFEFWPTWLMYLPVGLQWLLLSVRHGSLTLPLIANPRIPLAGMVGGSKDLLFSQATGACRAAILPWFLHTVSADSAEQQAEDAIASARAQGIELPFVCKPDMGCRGSGVKLIRDAAQLTQTIASYPPGAGLICQQLAQYEPEVGIFYVRHPDTVAGWIPSLTFKHTPAVTGDGESTVADLVLRDARAGALIHLYAARNRDDWHRVLAPGEVHRLLFSASHCRGAVFTDARAHVTPALTNAVNRLMAGLPDFHYGRLDVKFRDIASLERGEHLEIVEINGASAESIHIWDKDATLGAAIKALLWQYRTLFQLGAVQRRRGVRTPGLGALLRHWQMERRLARYYPETD
ncbi:MAG: hypothetical protein RL572_1333 [Pseudomonadota bacterium]|jgi:hypothetical protein